jgi:uncharacterized RDD family membrane protein YckC
VPRRYDLERDEPSLYRFPCGRNAYRHPPASQSRNLLAKILAEIFKHLAVLEADSAIKRFAHDDVPQHFRHKSTRGAFLFPPHRESGYSPSGFLLVNTYGYWINRAAPTGCVRCFGGNTREKCKVNRRRGFLPIPDRMQISETLFPGGEGATLLCLVFPTIITPMTYENGPEQLDTRIRIVTPENIAFQYRVAGPFRRLPAYLLDCLLRAVLLVIFGLTSLLVFGSLGLHGLVLGMYLTLWFVLSWFYGGVFETFWNGQTPGKRLMRIRVISVDGQPINGMQAVLRNILREIDAQPMYLFQVGLLSALMNDRFQRLGDLAAGTMVVVEEGHWLRGLIPVNDPEVAQLASMIPANFIAKRSLAQALSAYVERRGSFAWGRRLEIARHLAEPLRDKFHLPSNTNLDLLLCALYHRTFIAEGEQEELSKQSGIAVAERNVPAICKTSV